MAVLSNVTSVTAAPQLRAPLRAWSGNLLGSLKLRLALIGALLIAASVAVTVNLVLRQVGQRSEEVALDMSLAQTRKMARMISGRLIGLQLALGAVARQLDTQRIGDGPAMREFLAANSVLGSLFDGNFIARLDGRMVALSDAKGVRDPMLDIADRSYFRLTLQQGRPIVSEPIRSRATNEPVILLTVPVRGNDGRIVAVIGGSLRLASRGLLPDITDADEDDPAITVVVDAQGRIISHPDRQWLLRDITSEPTLAGAAARWIAQGRPVEPSGQSMRLGEQLVTSAGVPDAEWVIFRVAPVSAVLGSVQTAHQRALWIGAAVALAGGAALLALTFAMLRPLRLLERRALRLLDEHDNHDADWPRSGGEIGRLAQVLQHVMHERAESASIGRELLERLQAVMAHAPVGIGFTRDRKFEAVSTRFHHLMGYPPGDLEGQPARLIYASDEFYDGLGARVGAAFGAGQAFDEEIEFLRRDGSRFWGRLQGAPVRAGDPVAGTIWTLEDVSEQRRQREALSWTSTHDALTALTNRAEFERRLGSQVANRRREPVSALFIDLDRFKAVNDSAGHAAGDRMLVEVARALERQVRGADTVARLGGDEFAVLLPSCDRAGAAQVAEKMRAAIEALKLPWAGQRLGVGASFGVVELDASLPDMAAVMAAADAACYAAKRDGRNGVRVHGVAALRLVGNDGKPG